MYFGKGGHMFSFRFSANFEKFPQRVITREKNFIEFGKIDNMYNTILQLTSWSDFHCRTTMACYILILFFLDPLQK